MGAPRFLFQSIVLGVVTVEKPAARHEEEEDCMQLTRLVYASHHGGTSEEALRDIFDRSCLNNENDGITGLLIAGEEDFLQLLEGGRTAVAECMMRIMKDDRHQRIRILLAGETGTRLFSQWSMRCLTAAQIPQELQDRY